MKEASIIGLDLAKRSFQAHGTLADGRVAFRKKLTREKVLGFFAEQPRCIVAMEACGSAHHWGRAIRDAGHEVRLIPPAYVKPFVKRQKNDAADAEAIAEAASRPTMRFVAVKTEEQQARAMLFRTRDLLVRQRTQLINALRGQLSEHGVVAPQGPANVAILVQAIDDMTPQQGLIIAPAGEPAITTDDLEIAQFICLLVHNEKIRDVIDTITSKVVLILGRFSIPERKQVLDALRDELRKRNYAPVVFDFEKPTSRTTDETITLLARMARFVIADISDAKSVLQELRAIVPDNPSVPVQSIIDAAQDEPGMFDFLKEFRSFLKVYRYRNPAQLLADLDKRVIAPPEAKAAKRGASAKLASTRLPPSGLSPRPRG